MFGPPAPVGQKGTQYERVGDAWHPKLLRVVRGARRAMPATCAPSVDAADGKVWHWEGDRTGRGPAKLVFGVAPTPSRRSEAKDEEKKSEESPRRSEAKPDPLAAAAKALDESTAEAKHLSAPASVERRPKR
jgi:hypothetical protein